LRSTTGAGTPLPGHRGPAAAVRHEVRAGGEGELCVAGTAGETGFTEVELKLLDRLVPVPGLPGKRTVGDFMIRLARLGGYLKRKAGPPPGHLVL
jgi:hypothetical protein